MTLDPDCGSFGILRAVPTSKSRRILVVDDNIDHAESFVRLLEALGHQAELAATPEEALAVTRRLRPQLVCLDISMPVTNGYQLARMMRAEFGYETMRIVAVTGYGGDEYQVRSRQAGFDAHVVKPVSIETVEGMLATVWNATEPDQ